MRKFVKLISSIPFVCINLFILIINFQKIVKAKTILIQDGGGFGHSFILQDVIRLISKETLYIQLFESYRHNQYLPTLLNIDFIILKINIRIKIFNFTFIIGEVERQSIKPVLILLNTIIKFLNSDCKKFYTEEFYDKELIPKYFNGPLNLDKPNKINYTYFELVARYKKAIDIEKFSGIFKNFSKGKKTLCLYMRKRQASDYETLIRNGSDFDDYQSSIKYIISKNYLIFLVGESYSEIYDKVDIKIKKNLVSYKSIGVTKDFFNALAPLFCDYYIGEHGGGQFFALYNKNSLILNGFPFGQKLGNVKIVYKNLFIDGKKIAKIEKKEKYHFNFFKSRKNYIVKSLNSEEILESIKKYVF